MDPVEDKLQISYIKDILSKEGFSASIQTINRIIKEEGFALPRRTREKLGITKKNMLLPQSQPQ